MKRISFSGLSIALLAVTLSSGLIISSQWAQAQQATPTPTANTLTRTPTTDRVTVVATVEMTATREITATEPMTLSGIARGGTITVDGVGQASAVPDTAVIELGVQNRAVTASVALSQTNAQINALLETLTDAGVAEADIQTQNVSLFPVYDPPQTPTGEPVLAGFNATNIVRVRVRNLSSLGALLDAAVTAGANTIQSVQFELSDPVNQLAEARAAAVNNARRKAEQLAVLAGAELGSIRTIVESSSPVPVLANQAMGGGGAVPIAPGTQTVQVVVQITWQVGEEIPTLLF